MDTRKQHLVPQFYLSGFSREGKAWASRKREDGRFGNLFTTGIDNLCSKRDYYEVKNKSADGQIRLLQSNDFENWLSLLENELAPFLRKVRESRTTDTLRDIVKKSLYPIRILLANLMMRNPVVLDPSRAASEQFANALIAEGCITSEELSKIKALGLTPREIAEYAILWMELRVKTEGSSMSDILSWLDDAGVLALRARVGSQFVSADIPFALGWEDAKSELPTYTYLPLDWHTAIVFHKYNQEIASRYADTSEVDFWNKILITRTTPLATVIAKSEGTLRRVIEQYNTSEPSSFTYHIG